MAISFVATDNHLYLSETLVSFTSAQSMCYWAYYGTALSTQQVHVALSVTSSGLLGLGAATTGMQFGALGGKVAAYAMGSTTAIIAASVVPSLSTWTHVAFTWDGTTNTIYINGVAAGTSTTAHPTGTPTLFYINGYSGGTATMTSITQLDDLRMYTRALSAAEVQTIAALGGLRDGINYGLNISFPFNGAAGTTAAGSTDRVSGSAIIASGSGTTAVTYSASTLALVRGGGSC